MAGPRSVAASSCLQDRCCSHFQQALRKAPCTLNIATLAKLDSAKTEV
jgi:hypothetical protein